MSRHRAGRALPAGVLAALMTLGAGCASKEGPVEPSGFLLDVGQLEPSENGSALVYRRPGFTLGDYDAVLMDPIEIFCSSSSSFEDVDPIELKRLARSFEDAIQRALEDRYRFVDAIGPRVMRLRIAITNVEVRKRLLRDAVDSVGRDVSFRLSDITMEGEILDSRSGVRQVAFVDRRRSNQEADETAFQHWAGVLRKRMDEEHAAVSTGG